jgi:hypothetical protein
MVCARGSTSMASLIVGLLSATMSLAQNAPPTRVRGAIEAIDGGSVTIKTREGASVSIKLADNWSATLVVPVNISDIKKGSFVGIASLKGADGTQNALEVLVFPETARGSNEGHYPWDLHPESMMTNATVSTVDTVMDGQSLTLTYKDGTQTINVKATTPVVTFAPGERGDAKVGSKVLVPATRGKDGNLGAARILVGKGGSTPPM